MEQSDCLNVFQQKLESWWTESTDKKLTTQVLCGQFEVDHYPIRRTTIRVLSIFYQSFQFTKTPVFVRKHFKQSLCFIFLIFLQRFDKYLSSVLNPIIDV